MSKVPALAGILKEAGFSWATADEITSAIDHRSIPGSSSDEVAGALFRWRADAVRRRIRDARSRCKSLIDSGNNGNNNLKDGKEVLHAADSALSEHEEQANSGQLTWADLNPALMPPEGSPMQEGL